MQYRFHRMTSNSNGWKFPHGGRLGRAEGYVNFHGFGHEDWNFSGQIWNDGKHHLYLRSKPASNDLDDEFSIVLAVYEYGHYFAIGIAKHVLFEISDLSDSQWKQRADQLHSLDQEGQLEGDFHNRESEEIARMLRAQNASQDLDMELYWCAVEPNNLAVFDVPIKIPNNYFIPNAERYQLFHMTEQDYENLTNYLESQQTEIRENSELNEGFREGDPAYRWHAQRERNRYVVRIAIEEFLNKNGRLYCELCGFEPHNLYETPSSIIEAHHNIPLHVDEHEGVTRATDFRFLCPNCHRAVHKIKPWVTVEEFREEFYLAD